MLSLNAVGMDLRALAELGCALGFGLQRIASNFISGFILVFDRSIRPGDVISINQKFGWVQELRQGVTGTAAGLKLCDTDRGQATAPG